jgi:hypothetical protein
MWSARLVAMRTKVVHIALFLAAVPMLAGATDARAAANLAFSGTLVPSQIAFLTPPFPSAGDASSADAVVSPGVARIGADALQAAGMRGAGVRIAVLDQAFGASSRLDALAGTELPPLARQHRQSFDATYGLAGRDYNANSSRHGEFVTATRPTSSSRPSTTCATSCTRTSSSTPTRSCSVRSTARAGSPSRSTRWPHRARSG